MIEALNERPKLPKYLIMILDADLIKITKCYKTSPSYVLGSAIHQILKKLEKAIERRKCELLEKKPGALQDNFPKVVWIRMLRRPSKIADSHRILSLRGKFNQALEDNLAIASDKHHLMSIEIDEEDFDHWGKITQPGMITFWKELDRGLMKFDRNEI